MRVCVWLRPGVRTRSGQFTSADATVSSIICRYFKQNLSSVSRIEIGEAFVRVIPYTFRAAIGTGNARERLQNYHIGFTSAHTRRFPQLAELDKTPRDPCASSKAMLGEE